MYWKRNAKNKKLLIVRINILFFVNLKINFGAKIGFLLQTALRSACIIFFKVLANCSISVQTENSYLKIGFFYWYVLSICEFEMAWVLYIIYCSQTLLFQGIKTHRLEIGQMHLKCILGHHTVTVITHFKVWWENKSPIILSSLTQTNYKTLSKIRKKHNKTQVVEISHLNIICRNKSFNIV